eukprot:10496326-Alexandrium_andersonii.AAC.2
MEPPDIVSHLAVGRLPPPPVAPPRDAAQNQRGRALGRTARDRPAFEASLSPSPGNQAAVGRSPPTRRAARWHRSVAPATRLPGSSAC